MSVHASPAWTDVSHCKMPPWRVVLDAGEVDEMDL